MKNTITNFEKNINSVCNEIVKLVRKYFNIISKDSENLFINNKFGYNKIKIDNYSISIMRIDVSNFNDYSSEYRTFIKIRFKNKTILHIEIENYTKNNIKKLRLDYLSTVVNFTNLIYTKVDQYSEELNFLDSNILCKE